MNVSFIGYRCSGKTSISKTLEDIIGWKRIEIDNEITNHFKLKIPEIIEKHGWDKFRSVEKRLIKKYSGKDKLIIDAGGGAVLDYSNVKHLKKNGILIFLNCPAEILLSRLNESFTRPSLTNLSPEDEIKKVLEERIPLYKSYSDYTINSGMLTLNQCVYLSAYFIREHALFLNNRYEILNLNFA